jgi:hypothetical protein
MGSDDNFERRVQEAVFPKRGVPEEVVDRAMAAGRTRPPVGSLFLDLVYDSVLDPALDGLSAETSRGQVRLMTFQGGGLRLELRVDGDPGSRSVRGWTAPLPVVTAMLMTENDEPLSVEFDGRLRAKGLSNVPTCLWIDVDAPTGATYHSAWFLP